MAKLKNLLILTIALILPYSCKVWNNLNLYTPNDDVALGKQVVAEIEANPKEYPLLPERGNEAIYKYVRGISRTIVNSGQLQNKGAFAWQVKIIQ
ncbi:MAG: peptidase M48, partial [Saprospiraceae bacterium]